MVLVLLAIMLGAHVVHRVGGTLAAVPLAQAPDFVLTDQSGSPVRLSQFGGKVVLLDFIYTHCVDVCPLITAKRLTVQRELTKRGLFNSRVVFLTMTFDPERDTVPVMRAYAKRFGADLPGWYFLTGPAARISSVLSVYKIPVRRGPKGLFEHPAPILVIDQQRRLLGHYEHDFRPQDMIADLARLTSK